MNRSIVFALGWFLSIPVWAGSDAKKTEAPLPQYLEALQTKLDHAAQRANQPAPGASSVVGVRGSRQEPLSKQLYWKGKEKPQPVTVEEIRMFRLALDQARAGQRTEAVLALKAFQERYPKSALAPDAEETLRRLNDAAVSVSSAPAPAPSR